MIGTLLASLDPITRYSTGGGATAAVALEEEEEEEEEEEAEEADETEEGCATEDVNGSNVLRTCEFTVLFPYAIIV